MGGDGTHAVDLLKGSLVAGGGMRGWLKEGGLKWAGLSMGVTVGIGFSCG